jgi:hypothetical protein
MKDLKLLRDSAMTKVSKRLPQQTLNPENKAWSNSVKYATKFIPLLTCDEDFKISSDGKNEYYYCYGILLETSIPKYNKFDNDLLLGQLVVFRLNTIVATEIMSHFGILNSYKSTYAITVNCLAKNGKQWAFDYDKNISVMNSVLDAIPALAKKYPIDNTTTKYLNHCKYEYGIKNMAKYLTNLAPAKSLTKPLQKSYNITERNVNKVNILESKTSEQPPMAAPSSVNVNGDKAALAADATLEASLTASLPSTLSSFIYSDTSTTNNYSDGKSTSNHSDKLHNNNPSISSDSDSVYSIIHSDKLKHLYNLVTEVNDIYSDDYKSKQFEYSVSRKLSQLLKDVVLLKRELSIEVNQITDSDGVMHMSIVQ